MSTDHQIEAEIQAKGKTYPRITPEIIEENIVSEVFFTGKEILDGLDEGGPSEIQAAGKNVYQATDTLNRLTFCVLVLRNGFTVTGESACVSPNNFDAEIGRKVARDNAVQKLWPLMGYSLMETLSVLDEIGWTEHDEQELAGKYAQS